MSFLDAWLHYLALHREFYTAKLQSVTSPRMTTKKAVREQKKKKKRRWDESVEVQF